MQVQKPSYTLSARDLIVEAKDDEVIVELDLRHNSTVRAGEQYAVTWEDGTISILRVVGFRSAETYTPTIARATEAQREGVTDIPQTMTARKAYQTKLAVMRIEGELLIDGRRRVGASRLPDLMLPVEPLSDDAVEKFSTDATGNMVLGRLQSGGRTLHRLAKLRHNYAGDRMIVAGMPGKGKSQLVRALLSQAMAAHLVEGFEVQEEDSVEENFNAS